MCMRRACALESHGQPVTELHLWQSYIRGHHAYGIQVTVALTGIVVCIYTMYSGRSVMAVGRINQVAALRKYRSTAFNGLLVGT